MEREWVVGDNPTLLAIGGNACVIREQYGLRKKDVVVRISINMTFSVTNPESEREAGDNDDKIGSSMLELRRQNQLAQRFPETIIRIDQYFTTPFLPDAYSTAIEANTNGRLLIDTWESDDETLLLARSDYIGKSLNGASKGHMLEEPYMGRFARQLYMFLYGAVALYGFEHGDLTTNNILIASDETLRVIDFDFAEFNAFRRGRRRSFGSVWVLPPEHLRTTVGGQKKVIGAVDFWSAGVALLGAFVGNGHFLMPKGQHEMTPERRSAECMNNIYNMSKILGIQTWWMGDQEPSAEPMKRYEKRLKQLSPAALKFFQRVLNWDAYERTYRGEVERLFAEHKEFLQMPNDSMLKAKMQALGFSPDALPVLGKDAHLQVRNLIGDGIITVADLKCLSCGTKNNLQVCNKTGAVVCGIDCLKKHHKNK